MQPDFKSSRTNILKSVQDGVWEAPLRRVRSVGRCDKAGNCLKSSSAIHHAHQAAQMSMAVIKKKGREYWFEERLLIYAFNSTNNLIKELPRYTALEITQGTLTTFARKMPGQRTEMAKKSHFHHLKQK